MSASELILQAIDALAQPLDQNYPEARAWTSRICRYVNGLPETLSSVAYCGLCAHYANPRKRLRSARLPEVLPGMEWAGGSYKIHPPCPGVPFKKVQSTLHRLAVGGLVEKKRVQIPDGRQPRGWDYASNWSIRVIFRDKDGAK